MIFSIAILKGQTISHTSNMSVVRTHHQATLLNDGKVLITGGEDGAFSNWTVYRSCELFDPTMNTWSTAPSMNNERRNHCATLLNDGRVLVTGGEDLDLDAIESCEIYDPQTKSWEYVSPMNYIKGEHRAIKLLNGNVLAVSRLNSGVSEIYDPYQNKWISTGSMIHEKGSGFTLTMLNDGRVIAIGGDVDAYGAEIYDPQTGLWQAVTNNLKYGHTGHTSTKMQDGRVLIVGSELAGFKRKAEIFNPIDNSFTETTDLFTESIYESSVLLDNGNVLISGFGDITSLSNTRFIKIYNPTTQTWTSGIYNFSGSFYPTATKLYDGRVLIAGGEIIDATYSTALIIETNSLSQCDYPELTATISDNNICYGKNIELQIENCEVNTTYGIKLGNYSIHSIIASNTKESITIPYQNLAIGENTFIIKGKKNSCYSHTFSTKPLATILYDNQSTIDIINNDTSICIGSSIELQTITSSGTVVWNTNENASKITVNEEGTYYAYSKNTDGCLSIPSDTVSITFLKETIAANAGSNRTGCENSGLIELKGSPLGGYWTGENILAPNFINSENLSTGTYQYTYHYCGLTDTMNFTILDKSSLSSSLEFQLSDTVICEGANLEIAISNADKDEDIRIFINNTLYRTISQQSSYSVKIYNIPDTIKTIRCDQTLTNECFTDVYSVERQVDIVPLANADIEVGAKNDTVCAFTYTDLNIINPETNVGYYIISDEYPYLDIPDTLYKGNSDTLFFRNIPVRLPNGYFYDKDFSPEVSYSIYGINKLGCSEKLNNQIKITPYIFKSDFSISKKGQFINDTITAINHSNGNVCTWITDTNTIIIEETVDYLTFTKTSQGESTISLYVDSSYGCTDTITKTVYFQDSYTNSIFKKECSFTKVQNEKGLSAHYPAEFVKHDNEGNTYIVSHNILKLSYTHRDILITKINTKGIIEWTVRGRGTYADCESIIIDDNKNIYVCGAMASRSGYDIFGANFTGFSNNSTHGFVAKINSKGKVEWVILTEPAHITDIHYQNDTTIYLSAGSSIAQFSNGKIEVKSNSYSIIKIDSKGNYIENSNFSIYSPYSSAEHYNLLGEQITGTNSEGYSYFSYGPRFYANSDSLYVLGYFKNNITVNGTKYFADTLYNYTGFLAKTSLLSKNDIYAFETFEMPKDLNEEQLQHIKSRAVEHKKYNIQIDSNTSEKYLQLKNSIIKYSPSNEVEWVYNLGGTRTSICNYVLYNKEIYVFGSFYDYLSLDSNYVITNDKDVVNKLFLLKIDEKGETAGINTFGSFDNDIPRSITLSPQNELLIYLYSFGDLYFEDKLITNASNEDILLSFSLDSCVPTFENNKMKYLETEWVIPFINGGDLSQNELLIDEKDNIYWSGSFSDSLSLIDTIFSTSSTTDNDALLINFSPDKEIKWANQISSINNAPDNVLQTYIDSNNLKIYFKTDTSFYINGTSFFQDKYTFLSLDEDGTAQTIASFNDDKGKIDDCNSRTTNSVFAKNIQHFDKNDILQWDLQTTGSLSSTSISTNDCNTVLAGFNIKSSNEYGFFIGEFDTTIIFDAEYLNYAPCGLLYINKVTDQGRIDWCRVGTTSDLSIISPILNIGKDNIITCIFIFSDPITFNNDTLSSKYPNATAIIKFDQNGNIISSKVIETNSSWQQCMIDKDGNYYFSGTGSKISKYDKDGNFLWQEGFPCNGGSAKMAIDNKGAIYVSSLVSLNKLNEDFESYKVSKLFLYKLKDKTFGCEQILPSYKKTLPIADTSLCVGKSISVANSLFSQLYVENNTGEVNDTYVNKITFNPKQSKTYKVFFQNKETGCYTTYDTIRIEVNPSTDIKIDTFVDRTNDSAMVQLNAYHPDIEQYKWTPDSIFKGKDSSYFELATTGSIKIQLETINKNGCISKDDITIVFSPVIIELDTTPIPIDTVTNKDSIPSTDTVPVDTISTTTPPTDTTQNQTSFIKYFNNEHIEVFPIPTSREVNVHMPIGCKHIKILDLKGTIVGEYQGDGSKIQRVILPTIPKGVYILLLTYGDKTYQKEIIVE